MHSDVRSSELDANCHPLHHVKLRYMLMRVLLLGAECGESGVFGVRASRGNSEAQEGRCAVLLQPDALIRAGPKQPARRLRGG